MRATLNIVSMDRRCVGLEYVGERSITDDEAKHLHKILVKHRTVFLFLSLALIIAIPAWPLAL